MLLKPRYPSLNRQHSLAKGLALSWLFHEHGGKQINDLSGNGYNASLTGLWTVAPSGSAAKTDGSTTEVVLTRTSGQTSPSLQVGDFTVAVKFSLSTLGSYTPVFDSYDSVSGGRNYSLFVNAGGGAAFVYYNVGSGAGTDGIGIGTTIAVNTWYDLVVTRKGSLSSFYINGKLGGTDSSQTGTVNNTTSTRTLSLGGNPSGGGTKEPFIYDYLSLWSRALTPGEVERLYRDPFTIYRPQWRRRFNSAAAGGASGVGAAAGTGTATGIGAAAAVSPGTATGTGTATAVGASAAVAVGAASGTGTATATGAATAAAVGSASGTGTATGIAAGGGVGAATGTGTATGVGSATAAAVGAASGVGTALGIGLAAQDTGYVAPPSTIRSWRKQVLDADPDFHQESTRPVIYEFSSGRKFRQKPDPYS